LVGVAKWFLPVDPPFITMEWSVTMYRQLSELLASERFCRAAASSNKANSLGRQKAPLRSAFCLR
jgi:hypothetical protein